ncbi:MAG: hypothetical protein Tsb0014_32290 [Pleurocapsa sp.]
MASNTPFNSDRQDSFNYNLQSLDPNNSSSLIDIDPESEASFLPTELTINRELDSLEPLSITETDLAISNEEILTADSFVVNAEAANDPFQVVELQTTNSGFTVEFNRPLDAEVLNLYHQGKSDPQLIDITLTGETVGEISGSVVLDDTQQTLTFIKTGAILAPDNYTVTLAGRNDGIVDRDGNSLDGDEDGTPEGDYITSFTVAPTEDKVLSVADFARGTGQTVDIPNTAEGLPISISDGEGVTEVSFELVYDPDLLAIATAQKAPDLPDDWQLASDLTQAGRAKISLSGSALSAGSLNLVSLSSAVPATATSGKSQILSLENLSLNNQNTGIIGDSALHQVNFLGDVNGDDVYSNLDAYLISRVAVGLDRGFENYPHLDPIIIGDTSSNLDLSALDSSLVARKVAGLSQTQIPFLPSEIAAGELNEAVDLGTISQLQTVSDEVNNDNPSDYYRFSLDNDSLLTLNLDGLTGDADVELIQDINKNKAVDDNEILNFALEQGTEAENLISPLPKGNYYIRVFQREGATNYDLSLSATPADGLPDEEYSQTEGASPGEISITGVSETTFNPKDSTIVFNVSEATFSSDPEDIFLYINGELVTENLDDIEIAIEDNSVSVSVTSNSFLVQEGRNEIELYATDSEGFSLTAATTLWVGENTLNVTLLDENNQPVADTVVTLRLNDDRDIVSQATTSNTGQVVFQNLPDRSLFLETTTSDNRFVASGTIGSAGAVILNLEGFEQPSDIDNNDFNLGTDGWNIGDAPVELIPHQEEFEPPTDEDIIPLSLSLNSLSQKDNDTVDRSSGESEQFTFAETFIPVNDAFSNLIQAQATNSNTDLVLNTSGQGEQSISRTFTTKPGTETVTIRYRFVTSEVPGGYFGSEFNDYFRVVLRSKNGGGFEREVNSMNALGLGAFDANGATQFREVILPVSNQGDTVQVDIAVANVADDLYDSQVVVDFIEESNLDIDLVELKDIDNSRLSFLSVDGKNPYFGGNTRINGKIKILGDKDDSLKSVQLEIVQGGKLVATANLAQNAQSKLLNQTFGNDGKIEINTNQLLFELPNSEAGNIDVSQNGTVSLRVKAISDGGGEVTKDIGAVQLLGRYAKSNRYGQRDKIVGGDDWALPSVIDVIEHFGNQIILGDFSNMNGGRFSPHSTHRDGTHIDGWFNGYNDRNAATAQTMINLLNDPTYGYKIRTVLVTFQKTSQDTFWNAIKDVTLDDGRKASNVIKPYQGHTTHFHWVVNP